MTAAADATRPSDAASLAAAAKAIHKVNGEWSDENDNECGHGSEPGQCEEAAAAALAAILDGAPEAAGTEAADGGLRKALVWFLDNNPNAEAGDLVDGIRLILDGRL